MIVAIDPGISTGVAVGEFYDNHPLAVRGQYQLPGGLTGLVEFLSHNSQFYADWDSYFVTEKFTPRPNQKFGQTLKTVEPLRIEGYLVGSGFMPDYPNPRWQQPQAQYFMGGSSLTEKKKRSRQFLKDHDLYLTGKDVGQKDADDAISATLHLFAYMRNIRHMPTLETYFGSEDA